VKQKMEVVDCILNISGEYDYLIAHNKININ